MTFCGLNAGKSQATLIGQSHPKNPKAAQNGFKFLLWECMIIKIKNKKMLGPLFIKVDRVSL